MWTAWLGVGSSVFLMLFACGQFALLGGAPDTAGMGASSSMAADYSKWQPAAFAAVNPGIILAALRDFGLDGLPVAFGGADSCLLGITCATPSPTPAPSATASPTTTPAVPTATEAVAGEGLPSATPVDGLPGARGSASSATPTTAPSATPTDAETAPPEEPVVPPTATSVPPTPTHTPCPAGGCEPDIGPPDGSFLSLAPGTEMVFNLSSPIVVDGAPDYDLVYYERLGAPGPPAIVLLDLVVVRIGQTSTGEWFVVFDWGDGEPDTNTNVGSYGADGIEEPNAAIPVSALYGTPGGSPVLNTGIAIDVDNAATPVPAGVYDLLSVAAPTPPGGGWYPADQQLEVDALEILPTSAP